MKSISKMPMKSCLIVLLIIVNCCSQDDNTIPNLLKLRFTPGATMGIFVALAFPIDLPGRDAYYSHFFEAIHNLPSNQTFTEYPPLVERDMDRQMIYKAFERKIKSNGYPGKFCLLRTICEVSQHSIEETNGVLGEIIHVILTPSSTKNFGLSQEYVDAEINGRNHDCLSYNKNCTVSFLDLVSWAENTL